MTNLNKAITGTDMDSMAIEEIVKATWNDGAPTASFNNAAQVWSVSPILVTPLPPSACLPSSHFGPSHTSLYAHAQAVTTAEMSTPVSLYRTGTHRTLPCDTQCTCPRVCLHNGHTSADHTFFWDSMKPEGGGEPSGKLMEAITSGFGSFEEFSKQFKTAAVTQFGSGWAWLVTDSAGSLSVVKTPNAETPIASGTGVRHCPFRCGPLDRVIPQHKPCVLSMLQWRVDH